MLTEASMIQSTPMGLYLASIIQSTPTKLYLAYTIQSTPMRLYLASIIQSTPMRLYFSCFSTTYNLIPVKPSLESMKNKVVQKSSQTKQVFSD